MKRSSTAIWYGTGKTGSGKITSQSKALDHAHYAYNTRFEEEKGTNPEELIAAAHAGCFTMKLSFLINEAGFTADEIETKSTVTLEKSGITKSHLSVKAKVPNLVKEKFIECAERAKNECPVSRALGAIIITMDAELLLPIAAD